MAPERVKYKRHFLIHKPTGILHTFLTNDDLESDPEKWAEGRLGEPNHIMVQGEIESDLKTRKRGVWMYSDNRKKIYFTCPWCGVVGMTDWIGIVGTQHAESIFCGNYGIGIRLSGNLIGKGCGRHLTLSYRLPGKEKKNYDHYDYE